MDFIIFLWSIMYLNKQLFTVSLQLFRLAAAEQKRLQNGKEATRDDIKSFDKDTKTLAAFFKERHHFIKIHMIYKRFQSSYPGAVFQELAKFYNVMATEPNCQKLLKEAQKAICLISKMLIFLCLDHRVQRRT